MFSVENRANKGNPKGNYEYKPLIDLNERILRDSGGSWQSPPEKLSVSPEHLDLATNIIQNIIKSKPADEQRWGLKDPRTVLTFPIWSDCLHGAHDIIITIRHPLLVAISLHTRNKNISLQQGLRLWTTYNQKLLSYIETNTCKLFRFDLPENELFSQIHKICIHYSLQYRSNAITSWYDSGLLRSNKIMDAGYPLDRNTESLWESLLTHYNNQTL